MTLHGTTSTIISRHYAAADALEVPGVESLDNKLKVKYPAAAAPSDEQIRKSIEHLLEWNSSIDSKHVRVRVENGIVTLEGSVDALWRKFHAEDVLMQLTGVAGINNKLTVVPTKDVSDELIAESLNNALSRNPMINADAIEVRVANGVVRLGGAVPNWTARQIVYNSALNTFGAIGVDDAGRAASEWGVYGVPEGLVCSFPVRSNGTDWQIVEGLEINEFSRARIDASAAELAAERDAVVELGLV